MIVEVNVPVFAESITEGTLLAWHKKIGEAVARDEILVDIETDKVVLEVPAPQAGVLVEIIVNEGDTVTSQQVLAKIDTEAAAVSAAPAQAAPAAEAAAPAAASNAQAGVAMPAAAKLAAEKGVDVGSIQGSGRDGRVLKEDVQNASAAPKAAAPAASIPVGARPEERVPMSRLRARVAERLLASQQENAILTTFNEVNMKPIMDLRAKYKEKFEKEHGVKLGFMSFFVKAAVAALKKYPVVNASVDGNDIVYHGYFDIGIAIGSPRGLVVPILRDADQMSIADIEQAIVDYAKKAKRRQNRHRRPDRRHLQYHQRRHFRLHDVHSDHQPAAICHFGYACDQRARRGRKRPSRCPPDDVFGTLLRPPHHRRPRSRADFGNHQRPVGRPCTPIVGFVSVFQTACCYRQAV